MPLPARPLFATLLLGLPLIAGCAASTEDDAWMRDILERQQRMATGSMPATRPAAPASLEADPTVEFIPENATARDYVRVALEHSPRIRAAEQRLKKMLERIEQMTSLEDPMLEVTPIGEMSETMAGEVMTMVRASQKLPFPGKLSAQGRLAWYEAAETQSMLEKTRLEVASDVRKAYWSYYLATRSIELNERSRDLLKQFRVIAENRTRSGGDQADVLRAGVEESEIENELVMLRQRRTSAMAMLNSLLDRPLDARLPPPAPASLSTITGNLNDALQSASWANPDLQALQHRIGGEMEKQRLATLQRYPDLTILASYSQVDSMDGSSGKDEWSIGFAINVPIWFQKYRAAEREALHGRLEAIAELAAMQNTVSFQILDAMSRVQAQQKQVELFRDSILPQSRQAVELSQSGYQSGRADFMSLLETSRKSLTYEVLYHQNLAQLEQDLAELETAIGTHVSRHAATQPTTRPGK